MWKIERRSAPDAVGATARQPARAASARQCRDSRRGHGNRPDEAIAIVGDINISHSIGGDTRGVVKSCIRPNPVSVTRAVACQRRDRPCSDEYRSDSMVAKVGHIKVCATIKGNSKGVEKRRCHAGTISAASVTSARYR